MRLMQRQQQPLGCAVAASTACQASDLALRAAFAMAGVVYVDNCALQCTSMLSTIRNSRKATLTSISS